MKSEEELMEICGRKNQEGSSIFRLQPITPSFTSTMMRSALLLALAIVGGADAFKFMSNFQPAKILTNDQKVELAKTKERFGDKSKFS